jgi:hypothetical protein
MAEVAECLPSLGTIPALENKKIVYVLKLYSSCGTRTTI